MSCFYLVMHGNGAVQQRAAMPAYWIVSSAIIFELLWERSSLLCCRAAVCQQGSGGCESAVECAHMLTPLHDKCH